MWRDASGKQTRCDRRQQLTLVVSHALRTVSLVVGRSILSNAVWAVDRDLQVVRAQPVTVSVRVGEEATLHGGWQNYDHGYFQRAKLNQSDPTSVCESNPSKQVLNVVRAKSENRTSEIFAIDSSQRRSNCKTNFWNIAWIKPASKHSPCKARDIYNRAFK